jgi:hypothetical protein
VSLFKTNIVLFYSLVILYWIELFKKQNKKQSPKRGFIVTNRKKEENVLNLVTKGVILNILLHERLFTIHTCILHHFYVGMSVKNGYDLKKYRKDYDYRSFTNICLMKKVKDKIKQLAKI